jgi:peptidoglycan/LPS O-acetylase OafA/YrhL
VSKRCGVYIVVDEKWMQPQGLVTGYRPEIDGLRALAVLAVIINHLGKEHLPSGYLGVDIFFVISGFVITSSLASRRSESRGFLDFLGQFYVRRIRRLMPALAIFVGVTAPLLCFFSFTPNDSLGTGFAALFGLSNILLLRRSTDYFASATELNAYTHTWSLGVEEQFYFLYPLLFWWLAGRRKGLVRLSVLLGVLSAVSLAGFIYLYQTKQPAAYFLMPTRFWELGI